MEDERRLEDDSEVADDGDEPSLPDDSAQDNAEDGSLPPLW
ncbi:MAG: hypothetical protein QOF21_2614 [Actinomycetota bacterium]|jgi:hypothetical protein